MFIPVFSFFQWVRTPLNTHARFYSLGVVAALLLSLNGCDFLKIKEEAVTAPVTQKTEPPKTQTPPPAPPAPPPPPPVATPEQVAEKTLADFKAKPTVNRGDGDVLALANLYEPARLGITELSLESSQGVTIAGTKALKAFPNLKALNLGLVTSLDETSVLPILECKKLESLYLDQVRIDDNFLRSLGKMASIRDLQLSGTQVSERALGNLLSQLPNLERLMLVGINIEGKCFLQMSSKNLKYLFIDKTRVYPGGIKALTKQPLIHLSVIECQNIGDQGMIAISNLKELKILNASDNARSFANEGNKVMIALGKMKNLESLRLVNNPQINDVGLMKLKGLKNLKKLVVNGSSCTSSGLAALQKFIPDLNKEGM